MDQATVIELPAATLPGSHAVPTGLSVRSPVPQSAKWSYVTRNVNAQAVGSIAALSDRSPEPGDLLVARVRRIAQHTKIQLRSGRRSQLFPGDNLVVAYGNRYAPDQFEALVPEVFDRCHLVAAGGIAAQAISKNTKLKWPSEIQPQGYLLDHDGKVLNLRQFGIAAKTCTAPTKPVICVAGTSMNAGKTTVMSSLTKGLSSSGLRVAAIKATGTGAGNDTWAYADAGASLVVDFTDAGYPSTYKVPSERIEACLGQLVSHCSNEPAIDVVLVEIADGLLHGETMALLRSPTYTQLSAKLIFAAGEAMGALAGTQMLRDLNIQTTAISGLLTASQLASLEAANATGLPVLSKSELESPDITRVLF